VPEFVLVAEVDGCVAGYVAGVLDTVDWQKRLEQCWWPDLRHEYPAPNLSEREQWTPDARRVAMIHCPEGTPAAVTRDYPAHLHLNLLPGLQGLGVGPKLLSAWFDRTMQHGTVAAHVGVNRANARAARFWAKMGFRAISPDQLQSGRRLWMGRS